MNGLPPAVPSDPNAKKRKAPTSSTARKRSKKQDDAATAADGTAAAAASPAKKPRQKKGATGGDSKTSGAKVKGKSADDELELLEKDDTKVEEEPEEKLGKTHSGVFAKDLPWLLYGFGDADKPLKETVDLVEDIAVQFITDTVHAAMQSAAARNPGGSSSSSAAKKDEIRLEDLLFAVRRDPRKVARIQELIRRREAIKDARKLLAGDEEGVEDMADL